MMHSYSTDRAWPVRGAVDLVAATRRAEGVARSLGWPAKDAEALSRMVFELGGNAIQRTGGGSCHLQVGATSAEVTVEDLRGGRASACMAFTAPEIPFASVG